tara:strand:- start:668 stop:1165 length:498 start_codon:yes stop_codon:yes gene_type:complete
MNIGLILKVLVVGNFLTGCSGIAMDAAPIADTNTQAQASASTKISRDVTSWGRVVSHWELYPDGRYLQQEFDFNDGKIVSEKTDLKSPKIYGQVQSALKPLHGKEYIGCSGAPTDGPTSVYRWQTNGQPSKLSFYIGCYGVNRTPDIQLVYDAEQTVYGLIPWIN